MKKLKQQTGITLVALIITIIVLLILSVVTIQAISGDHIINHAENARDKYKKAQEDELAMLKYYEKYLDGVNFGKAEAGTIANENSTINGLGADSNNPVIPAGFKAVNTGGASWDTTSGPEVNKGLVIADEDGNEFVWIPVNRENFTRVGWWNNEVTTKTLEQITEGWQEADYQYYIALSYGYSSMDEMIEDREYNDYASLLDDEWGGSGLAATIAWFNNCYWWAGVNNEFNESASSDPTGEYENMLISVAKYGGFYLGRYEAGTDVARNNNSGTTDLVVKQGAYPYNYVVWGKDMTDYTSEYTWKSGPNTYNAGHGAAYLSKNIYTGDNYGAVSTLCYGVQWDAAMQFVKDSVNVTNSTEWGNYYNHSFTFSGKYSTNSGTSWTEGTNVTKPTENKYLLTTGASEQNKAKNIYDLAGNIWERTMESYSTSRRVSCGGAFPDSGNYYPAVDRSYGYPYSYSSVVGFRVALYVK